MALVILHLWISGSEQARWKRFQWQALALAHSPAHHNNKFTLLYTGFGLAGIGVREVSLKYFFANNFTNYLALLFSFFSKFVKHFLTSKVFLKCNKNLFCLLFQLANWCKWILTRLSHKILLWRHLIALRLFYEIPF